VPPQRLDARENLPKERPRQLAFGELQREVPACRITIRIVNARAGMEYPSGVPPERTGDQEHHPAIILQLEPHKYAVAAWRRDEDGEAVYEILHENIRDLKA
jgi:hypothetical protein